MRHSVDEIITSNGVKGLMINIPGAPVVATEWNFRAGDYLSPKGKWEVAHILEHMVLGANKQYPKAREFHAELTKNGAYSNASTSAFYLNYILESAKFEWERVINLLKVAVESPILSDEEFKSESGNVIEELTGDLNYHFRQLLILSREKHGLISLDDAKRLEQINNISNTDIRAFYERTHVSDNLRFIMAGDFNKQDKEFVREIFENINLKRGQRQALPTENPIRYDDVFYIERPGLKNLFFLFHTFLDRELEPKEELALTLVRIYLTETLHSKILGRAREMGLAYDLTSHFLMYNNLTEWWFGAEIRPENVEKVFEIIVEELKALLKGSLDIDDMNAAKKYLAGNHQRQHQTAKSLVRFYAGNYFHNERIRDERLLLDILEEITQEDMVKVTREMFAKNLWGLSVLGTGQEELAARLNHQIAVLWN